MLWLLLPMSHAGDIYIHEAPDGTITFTDNPPARQGYEMFLEEKPLPAPSKINFATFPLLDSFDEYILAASLRYGVDAEFIKAVAIGESGMNPNAISRAGAQGLMQIMPATATELGVEDPFDAEQAIDGGTRYLKQQLEAFGSFELALAAYNGGPHNVRKYNGIPPFEETERYVPRIMTIYEYLNVERPVRVE
ncbi:MAG: lytic transglycosylase domain-containing protein [Proteobacteria bacterium]|nr:lytic transglycosylase domain-containing protein [Pseudomonadota bacterium]MCP4916891.1 lytic transglycosylase domain-containing protein [Pseudomonadota bacterium]